MDTLTSCALLGTAYCVGRAHATRAAPGERQRYVDKAVCAAGVAVAVAGHVRASFGLALFVLMARAISGRLRRRDAPFRTAVVGSANPVKVAAVRRALAGYPRLVARGRDAAGVAAPSGVADQPIGLDVVARGARHRAAHAHAHAHARAAAGGSGGGDRVLAFGLESGLFAVGDAHYDVCACAAYDGRAHRLGFSCAFAIPESIMDRVARDGMDLSAASVAAGYSADPNIGSRGGLIAVLTRGRVDRTDYTVQAVQMALAAVEDGRCLDVKG